MSPTRALSMLHTLGSFLFCRIFYARTPVGLCAVPARVYARFLREFMRGSCAEASGPEKLLQQV